jgi:MFS family permease
MQVTAQGFLVFQLTHSPVFLGYVGFASGAPIWLFTLLGGLVSDRMPVRNLLLITQTTMMILALTLAALTFFGHIQPWHIVMLAFGLGVANAFDAPARQAFAVELVEREDLSNAIALNSTMFNLATAIGPAIAGVVYVCGSRPRVVLYDQWGIVRRRNLSLADDATQVAGPAGAHGHGPRRPQRWTTLRGLSPNHPYVDRRNYGDHDLPFSFRGCS